MRESGSGTTSKLPRAADGESQVIPSARFVRTGSAGCIRKNPLAGSAAAAGAICRPSELPLPPQTTAGDPHLEVPRLAAPHAARGTQLAESRTGEPRFLRASRAFNGRRIPRRWLACAGCLVAKKTAGQPELKKIKKKMEGSFFENYVLKGVYKRVI